MKIVPKLTLSLVVGTCLILAANGYFRVRREVTFFEADRLRDHEMIGRSLSAAASSIWRAEGEGPALASIDAVNHDVSRIHIHWIAAGGRTHIDGSALAATPAGRPVTRTIHASGGPPTWYTYVPIEIDGHRKGDSAATDSRAGIVARDACSVR